MKHIKSIYEIFNIDPKQMSWGVTEVIDDEWNDVQNDKEEYKQGEKNFLDLPYDNIYYEDKDKRGFNYVFILQENIPVIYVRFKYFLDGIKISHIEKKSSCSIKNTGVLMYESIVKKLNKPIYSDISQTNESRHAIWYKLFEKYPSKVLAYNQVTKKSESIKNKQQKLEGDKLSGKFSPITLSGNQIYWDKGSKKVYSHPVGDPNRKEIDWPTNVDILDISFYDPNVFDSQQVYLLKFNP